METALNCSFSEVDFQAQGIMGRNGTYMLSEVHAQLQ